MIILILTIGLFVILLYFNTEDNENLSLEEQMFEDEQKLDIEYKDRYYNKKEPKFYHPVTGYKGTKAEMDVYIINRERKLKGL